MNSDSDKHQKIAQNKTHLVRTGFRDQPQIGDVDSLLQGTLIGSIEKSIEWDVLQDLVDSKFVGIEKHG
jgi:hypothetical protein